MVLCMVVQWWVGCKVEKQAGFLRTFIIYFLSGIGGYVVSGVFSPYKIAVGPDPALFGMTSLPPLL